MSPKYQVGCEHEVKAGTVPLWSDVGVDGIQGRQRVKPHHRLCGHILKEGTQNRDSGAVLATFAFPSFSWFQLKLDPLPRGSDNPWLFLFQETLGLGGTVSPRE